MRLESKGDLISGGMKGFFVVRPQACADLWGSLLAFLVLALRSGSAAHSLLYARAGFIRRGVSGREVLA